MRVAEAARRLGVSERSIYRLIRDGQLPALVLARYAPITGYDLDESLVDELCARLGNRQTARVTPEDIKAVIAENQK